MCMCSILICRINAAFLTIKLKAKPTFGKRSRSWYFPDSPRLLNSTHVLGHIWYAYAHMVLLVHLKGNFSD